MPTATAGVSKGLEPEGIVIARLASIVTERKSPREIRDWAAAPSQFALVMKVAKVLASQAVAGRPLAEAEARGYEVAQEALSAEGGALSAAGMARKLRMSRQGVDKRRREGRLLGVTFGGRGWLYPAWQADPRVAKGVQEVLPILLAKGFDPWDALVFLLNETPWLDDRTPLDALRKGEVAAVRKAAEVQGEHGAA